MDSEVQKPVYAQEEQQMRLLRIFHKVLAGLYASVGFCGFPHFIIGLVMLFNPKAMGSANGNAGDAVAGGVFAVMGLGLILFAWTLAWLNWMCSIRLAQKRGLKLIYATSGLNCLWMPLGTALGVFTLVVVARPSVRTLFPE